LKKSWGYAIAAVILGSVLIIVPTWLFITRAAPSGTDALSFRDTRELMPPFLTSEVQNHVEAISSKEVEALGISVVVALVIYVLIKPRTTRPSDVWPQFRSQ
jgi:hypothetical protein